MDPMAHLALATAAFVGMHYISSTPLRAALVKTLGENAYLGLYSLVAVATLGWTIWAYRHAPLAALWPGLRSTWRCCSCIRICSARDRIDGRALQRPRNSPSARLGFRVGILVSLPTETVQAHALQPSAAQHDSSGIPIP